MKRLAVLAVLLLSGCAEYSPEVTVLLGPKRIENDMEIGLTLSVVQRFGGHGACGYTHASDPQHGKPFNDEHEYTLDAAGCGVRFGGNKK
jgi:hypothetical protein